MKGAKSPNFFLTSIMQELGSPRNEISVARRESGSEMRSFTIRQAYHFKASPDRVFRALTEPKGLEGWFLSKARLAPMKGGDYSFDWLGGYHMTDKVKRFEPSKTVSFSSTDDCSSRWGYYLTNMKSVLDHRTDLRSKYDW